MLTQSKFLLFWFLLIAQGVFLSSARAEFLRNQFEGVRPLGMGNAYVGLADDANALWYNPAGLAQVKGAHFNLFDAILGFDSLNTLGRIDDALINGDTGNLVRPDKEFIRAAVLPSFYFPYFALTVYDNAQGLFDIEDLTTTGADAYMFNDLGVMAGVGIPIGDYFSFGFSLRVFERSEINTVLTPADLLAKLGISQTNFTSAVYTYLQSLSGLGYGIGLNGGVLFRVPLASKTTKLQIAAVAEDIGCTALHPINGTSLAGIPTNYIFGVGLKSTLSKDGEFNFDFDLRNSLDSTPLFEKIHVGFEYQNRFFGVRTGYYQGYPTFGVSLNMPPQSRINFTTYAVEEGNSLWSNGQRLYLVQLNIGFNPL